MAVYSLEPVEVPHIDTNYRTIKTKLPVPESLPDLRAVEEVGAAVDDGPAPIIWHKAEGFIVSDPWGNRWIDWSSCVLVSNAGHGAEEVKQALREVIDQGLLSTTSSCTSGARSSPRCCRRSRPSRTITPSSSSARGVRPPRTASS